MKFRANDNEFQNDWAFDEAFIHHIHISAAERGLNGYFCLGCKKEMQAVKGKKRVHYFRHHAKNVDKHNIECVVASRNYRELIARDILHRLKELKVPELFKIPPKGEDGLPMLLKPSETIKAHKVKSELTFYEDENCEIKFGQNPDIENRFLLIRPDITFFNEKNKPILLVEFVVSHKIDNEKKLKLKRLGLDTVQIIIPKKPETEIEKALKSKTKVNWVYNEIEANTKYIFVPETTNNGVWSIDDDQRNIFEESYKCRSSQIKYLIRTVKRALESQSYKRTEQLFKSEISRIEKATAAERKKLEGLETRIDKEVRSQFTEQNINLERQGGKLDFEESKFEEDFRDLERRYQSKREKIRREQEKVDSDKTTELENGGTAEEIRSRFRQRSNELQEEFEEISKDWRRSYEERRTSNRNISQRTEELPEFFNKLEREEYDHFKAEKSGVEERIEEQIRREERNIRELRDKERTLRGEFEKLERREFENFREQETRITEEEERNIKKLRDTEKTLSEEFRGLEKREQENFREQKGKIIEEEKQLERTIREELARELREPTSRLPKRISFILEAQRVGSDFKDAQRLETRYKRAREFFKKGTW